MIMECPLIWGGTALINSNATAPPFPKSSNTSNSQQPLQKHQMEFQRINKYIYTAAGDFKISFQIEPIKIQELWQEFYYRRRKNNALSMSLF